jgi:hypothetical protein
MTWKDKLELGLKNDAPYRKDNLPEQQVRGEEVPSGPGRSPVIPAAEADKENAPDPVAHETLHDDDRLLDEHDRANDNETPEHDSSHKH